jgi:hypothetical protein
MRPVATAGWQLDVDADVQRPADRVDGISSTGEWESITDCSTPSPTAAPNGGSYRS